MILMQAFLPRFLVLEVLLFLHFLDHGEACNKRVKKVSAAVTRAAEHILSCDRDSDEDSNGHDALPTCGVDLENAPPKNMPLFTTPLGELLMPVKRADKDPDVRWLGFPQADVQVHCPGTKLEASGTPGSLLICVQDSTFIIGSQEVAFRNLSCSRSIREKVTRSRESCGPSDGDGRMLEIGWRLTDGDFVPQISVCFDQDAAATHYARHTIRGAHIAALNDDPGRPSFKEGRGLYPDISADASYKVAEQEKVLKQLLGASKGASIFSRNKSFLAKGHLAPDADFVWKEWQDATYYFANAAPQWQPFNNGNWKAIEAEVRHFAEMVGHDVEVYTGTLGQLSYTSDFGEKVKLFLGARGKTTAEPTALPVPEFYWKVVHDSLSGEAVVFVGLNDPFFTGDPSVDAQICPDVCEAGLWFFAHRKDVARGYTYCCTYQEFSAVVEWAPAIGSDDPGLLRNRLI